MIEPTNPLPVKFPAAPDPRQAVLEALLADQASGWQRGQGLPVETYLQQQPTLRAQPAAVLDLIYQEIVLREANGEVASLDEYLQRFPHLTKELKVQFEIEQAMQLKTESANPTHISEGTSRPGGELAGGMLLGRYEIISLLGRGGMGDVYRARDLRLKREVAVKILPEHLARDADRLARFEREATAIAALDHPNIVVLHDVGQEQGIPFAVTELLEGVTLRRRLAGAALPWREALAIAVAVVDGLTAAHARGIIHRDIKPENVFLTADGRIKILDFGLARIAVPLSPELETTAARSCQTEPGAVLGTVGYMSPEQLRAMPVDARSDLFSLGCVLFELVAGQCPFQRPTAADSCAAILHEEPPSLGKQVPEAVERLIRRCLAKTADARFPSAGALAQGLRAALAGSADSLAAQPSSPSAEKAGNTRLRPRGGDEGRRLYLAARYYWDKRTEEGLRKSIAAFYQALDVDPNLALAWAGLADAYHQLGLWGHAAPTSACPKAKSAALKAIALDPSLGEGYAALAVILKDYEWDFAGAERAFQRALELNPDHALTQQWYGECLACTGRHTEAIAVLRRAQNLDPLSTNISAMLGRHGFFFARQHDSAIDQLRRTIATDPTFWIAHNFLGWVYLFQGRRTEAVAAFEMARQLDDNPETLVGLGYAQALAGHLPKAKECLDTLTELASARYVAPVNLALVYVGLGNKDQAFLWLDKACEDHSQWLSEIQVDPAFDPVRSDPRFASLLRRMNARGHDL